MKDGQNINPSIAKAHRYRVGGAGLRLRQLSFLLVNLGSLYAVMLYVFLGLRNGFSDRFWWVSFASNFTLFLFFPLLIFVPLAWLLRVRWALALMIPLCVGGAWMVGRNFIPKAIVPADAPINITTFNLWLHNWNLHRVNEWLETTTPDIVLMQEAPWFWHEGIPELRALYPYASGQQFIEQGNAKLILSRYPIRSVTTFQLTDRDIFRQQRAVIDVNGREIAVYNVHLYPLKGEHPRYQFPGRWEFPLWNMIFAFDDHIRREQVDELLARLADESLPFVVGGDFNFSDQTVLYERLAAQLEDGFRAAGWGMGWTWPADEAEGISGAVPLLARVDYIWHSSHFRAVQAQVAPPLGSDHLGLTVTLDMDWSIPRNDVD